MNNIKIKTSLEKIEKNKVKIKAEVPKELFEKDIKQAYKELSKSLKIPGFRKGNIPEKVIDARVGQDYVLKQALEKSLLRYYFQAVLKSKVKPIIKPEIKVEKLKKEKPLKFVATVLVEPEVSINKYKGIKVKKKIARVGEKEVKSQIEALRNQFAKLEEDKDAIVKNGSFIILDFDCYLDNKLLKENSANDYLLQVGSGFLFGNEEKKLIGMKIGDKKEVEILYSKNHFNKKIADKKFVYHIKLKNVKKRILLKVNDEFAKTVGGFNNIDELIKYIKDELKKKKKRDIESSKKVEILEKLIKNNPIDIPPIMIENRSKELINNFIQNLERQKSSLEDFLKVTNQDKKSFEENFKRRAEFEISHNLILDAISKKEDIKVSDETLKLEAKRIASYAGDRKDDVYKYYITGMGSVDLKLELRRRKTLDFLLSNAKIV